MCHGYTSTHHHPKVSIVKVDEEVLWKETQEQKDTVMTLDTASTTSSFSELDTTRATTRTSCLKIKNQAESLLHAITPTEHAKTVRFSTVKVHVHKLTLGDNPSISNRGPPLTISWDCIASFSMDVDEHQALREEDGIRRREELRVPAVVRMKWLDQEGFSFREMMKEQAKALDIGRKRKERIKECLVVEEKKELVRHKFQKWVLRKSDTHLYQEWKKQQSCQAAT